MNNAINTTDKLAITGNVKTQNQAFVEKAGGILSKPINNRHTKFKNIMSPCETLDNLFHLKAFIQVNNVAVIKRIETLPITINRNIK